MRIKRSPAVDLSALLLAPLIIGAVAASTIFKTEPEFVPATFDIQYIADDRSLLAPGYIFIDPLHLRWGYGPQIYTPEGELVWYGNSTATWRVQDFHVCDFLGGRGDHLCWHEARSRTGPYPVGRKVVFDNTYRQVGHNYTKAGNGTFPNTHEFLMLPGGESFLETIYEPIRVDLTPYNGPQDGWVFDACFAEIGSLDGDLIFKWCYLDHQLPLWETHLFIDGVNQTNRSAPVAGRGTFKSPWDFFHMNSIDKNSEGDYLISSRYLDQIIKISGPQSFSGTPPGTVLWKLGGTSNDFKMDFEFTRQHSARYISTERDNTLISLFSNHWDGNTKPSANSSEAQIIRIWNETSEMKAELVQNFLHPNEKLSGAQGNAQVLPNGNIFVGWGTRHQITEFSPTGTVLYDTEFKELSYRAFKTPWIGRPHWPPKLLSYMESCGSSTLHTYISWNGATEVTHWRFWVASSQEGHWIPAGSFQKDGFETHIQWTAGASFFKEIGAIEFPRFVHVEGLDSSGNALGGASAITFVPCSRTKNLHNCTNSECQSPENFYYIEAENCANFCCRPWFPVLAVAAMVCFAIEMIDIFYLNICKRDTILIHDDVEADAEKIFWERQRNERGIRFRYFRFLPSISMRPNRSNFNVAPYLNEL